MNGAKDNAVKPEDDASAAPTTTEKPAHPTALEAQYNPMAEILERHENAVNRLRRGK